jgi:hypothetical protein
MFQNRKGSSAILVQGLVKRPQQVRFTLLVR